MPGVALSAGLSWTLKNQPLVALFGSPVRAIAIVPRRLGSTASSGIGAPVGIGLSVLLVDVVVSMKPPPCTIWISAGLYVVLR